MSAKSLLRTLLAVFFIAAGANHFLSPAIYLEIMPRSLPWPTQLIAISGVAEMIGGVGLLCSRTQRRAAIGLIALLIAVFPANIEAIRKGMTLSGNAVPQWALWVRLPLQGVLIAWVYLTCLHNNALAKPRR